MTEETTIFCPNYIRLVCVSIDMFVNELNKTTFCEWRMAMSGRWDSSPAGIYGWFFEIHQLKTVVNIPWFIYGFNMLQLSKVMQDPHFIHFLFRCVWHLEIVELRGHFAGSMTITRSFEVFWQWLATIWWRFLEHGPRYQQPKVAAGIHFLLQVGRAFSNRYYLVMPIQWMVGKLMELT